MDHVRYHVRCEGGGGVQRALRHARLQARVHRARGSEHSLAVVCVCVVAVRVLPSGVVPGTT